ncbi:hypothetical protein [Herbaspirillum camelliae]|uniref:hypothetical protein n=1 Tax=Herbaspirillum camelliae TaxID=1892903 RepID=UPI000949DD3F|nr:hypothetical protein [Herbaspirillum camelliae]
MTIRDVSILHYSSGFPMVIGLHHVEDYKKIKVAAPTERMIFKRNDGHVVHGSGVTHGYHHYVITTRPRCMFRQDSFCWIPSEKKVVGELEFEVAYRQWKCVPFELFLDGTTSPYPLPFSAQVPTPDAIKNVRIALGPMGHPNRLLIDGPEQSIGLFLEPDLLHFIRVDDRAWPECLDFKVEYIGISTGKDGNRDFADRLWNHEKVREIAGIIQRDAPNLQIYVFGYQCRYLVEASPLCFIENSHILEAKLGRQASAEVLEAALIGHFRPAYNEEFKTFPAGNRPTWMTGLKEIIRPSYERPGKTLLSVVLASDNRHNANGAWTFGRFYTEHTCSHHGGSTDICAITVDLSDLQ